MHKNTRRTTKIFVRLDQDSIDIKHDANGREGMVSIRCLGKAIYGRFWCQGEIRWRVAVADIEWRETYLRNQVEDETDLTYLS